ncbi:hypothetical protein EJB05_36414 [Eragrostis curvula]|uniref:Uncharacterized protein n=1 Tax=Eragrostis curvula TaxID=38414 RepID=A0A5J9UAI8_9POAL|nr:hypothetical protein EJB05_36389 [Eragrostis curvula]TVU20215.1 hypothetical protein EJB05_36414 [Eragrostis curvula]
MEEPQMPMELVQLLSDYPPMAAQTRGVGLVILLTDEISHCYALGYIIGLHIDTLHEVYSISIGTILRGRYGYVVHHDSLTAIELEMALRTVDNRDTSYCDIGTTVKSQRLHQDVVNSTYYIIVVIIVWI